jgi:TonB family protein
MFCLLQTNDRRRHLWARAISGGVHLLFLVWLLHSSAPKFLKPSFVVRGNNGTLVAPLYWPSSKIASGATAHAERPHLTWNSERTRQLGRKRNLQARAHDSLQNGVSTSQVQPLTAGSPHGTVLEGPLSGDEVRPALPIVSSDPLVDASELPQGLKEGDVVVEITIDAQGNIVQKTVISSLGPAIDSKVLAALENWRFLPATHWGNPIPSKQDVHYHFPRTPAS